MNKKFKASRTSFSDFNDTFLFVMHSFGKVDWRIDRFIDLTPFISLVGDKVDLDNAYVLGCTANEEKQLIGFKVEQQ